jgi:hypothetical protein
VTGEGRPRRTWLRQWILARGAPAVRRQPSVKSIPGSSSGGWKDSKMHPSCCRSQECVLKAIFARSSAFRRNQTQQRTDANALGWRRGRCRSMPRLSDEHEDSTMLPRPPYNVTAHLDRGAIGHQVRIAADVFQKIPPDTVHRHVCGQNGWCRHAQPVTLRYFFSGRHFSYSMNLVVGEEAW